MPVITISGPWDQVFRGEARADLEQALPAAPGGVPGGWLWSPSASRVSSVLSPAAAAAAGWRFWRLRRVPRPAWLSPRLSFLPPPRLVPPAPVPVRVAGRVVPAVPVGFGSRLPRAAVVAG